MGLCELRCSDGDVGWLVWREGLCDIRRPSGETIQTILDEISKARVKYSGCDLLADLNRDDRGPLSGELRCYGGVKNFLRIASCDFEYTW